MSAVSFSGVQASPEYQLQDSSEMLNPVLKDHLQELPCMKHIHVQKAARVPVYVTLQDPHTLNNLQSVMTSCSRLMLCKSL